MDFDELFKAIVLSVISFGFIHLINFKKMSYWKISLLFAFFGCCLIILTKRYNVSGFFSKKKSLLLCWFYPKIKVKSLKEKISLKVACSDLDENVCLKAVKDLSPKHNIELCKMAYHSCVRNKALEKISSESDLKAVFSRSFDSRLKLNCLKKIKNKEFLIEYATRRVGYFDENLEIIQCVLDAIPKNKVKGVLLKRQGFKNLSIALLCSENLNEDDYVDLACNAVDKNIAKAAYFKIKCHSNILRVAKCKKLVHPEIKKRAVNDHLDIISKKEV